MARIIQVGDYNLRVERDWCITKRTVYICFLDADRKRGEAFTGCLYEIPIDEINHYGENFKEDDWYLGQALGMMEKSGGFARVARNRLAGQELHNATLQAEYDRGFADGVKSVR